MVVRAEVHLIALASEVTAVAVQFTNNTLFACPQGMTLDWKSKGRCSVGKLSHANTRR